MFLPPEVLLHWGSKGGQQVVSVHYDVNKWVDKAAESAMSACKHSDFMYLSVCCLFSNPRFSHFRLFSLREFRRKYIDYKYEVLQILSNYLYSECTIILYNESNLSVKMNFFQLEMQTPLALWPGGVKSAVPYLWQHFIVYRANRFDLNKIKLIVRHRFSNHTGYLPGA